jgi:hypothetical protein
VMGDFRARRYYATVSVSLSAPHVRQHTRAGRGVHRRMARFGAVDEKASSAQDLWPTSRRPATVRECCKSAGFRPRSPQDTWRVSRCRCMRTVQRGASRSVSGRCSRSNGGGAMLRPRARLAWRWQCTRDTRSVVTALGRARQRNGVLALHRRAATTADQAPACASESTGPTARRSGATRVPGQCQWHQSGA